MCGSVYSVSVYVCSRAEDESLRLVSRALSSGRTAEKMLHLSRALESTCYTRKTLPSRVTTSHKLDDDLESEGSERDLGSERL